MTLLAHLYNCGNGRAEQLGGLRSFSIWSSLEGKSGCLSRCRRKYDDNSPLTFLRLLLLTPDVLDGLLVNDWGLKTCTQQMAEGPRENFPAWQFSLSRQTISLGRGFRRWKSECRQRRQGALVGAGGLNEAFVNSSASGTTIRSALPVEVSVTVMRIGRGHSALSNLKVAVPGASSDWVGFFNAPPSPAATWMLYGGLPPAT